MIMLPDLLWQRLLDAFAEGPVDHERVAYLDGLRTDDIAVATTLTLPDAETAPRHYTVTAEAMSRAGAHLRAHGLIRLAQVHTHPGTWVDHSARDDRKTYSQRPGAVSVVLPDHGRDRPAPTDPRVGIHLRGPQGWHRLDADNSKSVLTVVPTTIDHRRLACATPPPTGIVAKLRAWFRSTPHGRSGSGSS